MSTWRLWLFHSFLFARQNTSFPLVSYFAAFYGNTWFMMMMMIFNISLSSLRLSVRQRQSETHSFLLSFLCSHLHIGLLTIVKLSVIILHWTHHSKAWEASYCFHLIMIHHPVVHVHSAPSFMSFVLETFRSTLLFLHHDDSSTSLQKAASMLAVISPTNSRYM